MSTSPSSRTPYAYCPVHIAVVSEFVCPPALLHLEDLDFFVSSIPSGSNTLSTPLPQGSLKLGVGEVDGDISFSDKCPKVSHFLHVF